MQSIIQVKESLVYFGIRIIMHTLKMPIQQSLRNKLVMTNYPSAHIRRHSYMRIIQ